MRRKRLATLGASVFPFRRYRMLLDPMTGELAGGGGGPGAPIESSDVPPTNGGPDRSFDDLSNLTIDDPSAPAGTSGDTAPIVPAPAAATPPPAAGQNDWQSLRDAAAAYGYTAPASIQDDRGMLIHLLQQAGRNSQADMYAQLGRHLAPKATEIQSYLAQQTQQQAAPTRQPWEAPEFDERWSGLVERDPGTGIFTAKQGVPHEIANKVNAFVEWQANFNRDPAKVINQLVEAKAQSIAETTFKQHFAEQTRQQEIGRIVQENSAWLYQKDAAGNNVVGYNNQYVPTPAGARYMQHLAAVKAMGVTDPRHQDMLAKQAVQAEAYNARQQSQQQASQQAASPQTNAAAVVPNANPLQSIPPAQRAITPGATEPSAAGKSLAQLLREEMAASGVTDADFSNIGG